MFWKPNDWLIWSFQCGVSSTSGSSDLLWAKKIVVFKEAELNQVHILHREEGIFLFILYSHLSFMKLIIISIGLIRFRFTVLPRPLHQWFYLFVLWGKQCLLLTLYVILAAIDYQYADSLSHQGLQRWHSDPIIPFVFVRWNTPIKKNVPLINYSVTLRYHKFT